MNKWLEIAFYIGCGIITTYVTMSSTLSQHSYRLDKLERDVSDYAAEAKQDRKEMRDLLVDIQIKLAQLSKK